VREHACAGERGGVRKRGEGGGWGEGRKEGVECTQECVCVSVREK